MDEKQRAREIITSLGGPASVAEKLGWSKHGGTQRVQNWLARGIPSHVKVMRPDLFMPELAHPSAARSSGAIESQAHGV